MPLDLLAVWGVSQAVGLVFRPILEELAKGAAKGAIVDYCKGALKNTFSVTDAEPLSKALGLAVKELLVQLQDELRDHGLTNDDLKALLPDVERFVHADIVKWDNGSRTFARSLASCATSWKRKPRAIPPRQPAGWPDSSPVSTFSRTARLSRSVMRN